MNIFVYGSLKSGFRNHDILGDSKFLGKVLTSYPIWDLLDLGGFPGLVEGKYYIFGELYQVDKTGIMKLDLLEGHPDFYCRTDIIVQTDPIFKLLSSHSLAKSYILQEGWGGSPVDTFHSEGVKIWI